MTVTNDIYQKQIKYYHKNVVVPEALRWSSAGQTGD
jgi:hypothetical protein